MTMEYKVSKEEKAFLENYSIEQFERPSVATDIVVFRVEEEAEENKKKKRPKKLQVLLIKRATYPYRDCWALPGGFCKQGEKVEDTASRELFEETNVSGVDLKLIGVYSEPGRDPRGWIISNTYMALIDNGECELRTDEEAWEAAWYTMDEIKELPLAFDHQKIIEDAFSLLKYYALTYSERLFDLLPPTFTLADVQQVYEEILQEPLTKQNFRRKMMEYVEETDEVETGYSHRNAKRFRKRGEKKTYKKAMVCNHD